MKQKRAKTWLAVFSAAALLAMPAAGMGVSAEEAAALAPGNVDGVGGVTAADALMVLQAATSKITLSAEQAAAADVDGQEGVTSADALMILQYATRKIDGFPSEGEQPDPDPTRTSGNPIFTDIFTADPSAHVWEDGRLYVYPSQDQFPAQGCDFMDKYHVYSTSNMVDWYDHGEILSSADVQEQAGWGIDGFMWAPDAAYKDGKYYFFFPHPTDPDNRSGTWKIGVAVSDEPASGFEVVTQDSEGNPYPGYITGIDYDNLNSLIDPCIFEDDDGRYYLAVGGGGHCYTAELSDDLLSIREGTWTEITEQLKYPGDDWGDRNNGTSDSRDFHEGAWIFKREGKYYMIFPDGHRVSDDGREGGNEMRYAMADNPMGPWTAMPDAILGPATNDTSHGSVVEYKGHWYIFYHNDALSGAGNLRSVCVDEIFFNEDGTIQPVVQTEEGVPAIGPAETGEYAPNQTGALIITDETIAEYKATYTHAYEYNLNFAKVGVDITQVPEDKLNPDGTPKEMPVITVTDGVTHTKLLTAPGAYIQFDGIVGGKTDGKALLEVHYSSGDDPNFQVKTNGMETGLDGSVSYYMRMYTTGDWKDYSGVAYCLIDLEAGADNTIWMAKGSGGANFTSITVYLAEDNVDPDLQPKDPTVIDYSVFTGPATTYGMANAVLGTTNPEAESPTYRPETQTVHNMERNGAYADIPNVDGGKGGRAMVEVEYSSANEGSLNLLANGKALDQGSRLDFESTGDWNTYVKTLRGVVDLEAGTDNTIRLTGGSGGYNIKSITVTLLPQG